MSDLELLEAALRDYAERTNYHAGHNDIELAGHYAMWVFVISKEIELLKNEFQLL